MIDESWSERPDRSGSADSVTLRELIERIGRRRRLVLGITGAVFLTLTAWTFLATPRYRSTAMIRVLEQQTGMPFLQNLEDIPGFDLGSVGQDELETEIGVLGSWRLNGAVVDSLGLRVRVRKPADARSRVLEVLSPGDPLLEGKVRLRYAGGGVYDADLDLEGPGGRERSTASVRIGEVLQVGDLRLRIPATAGEPAPATIRLEIVPEFEAVEDLQEDVTVRRKEGRSRLVEIYYDHPDRETAAAVVNSLLTEYLAYSRSTQQGETRTRADELRTQVEEHERRLAEAEESLREFQERARLVAPEEQATQQVRRVAEIQIRLDELEVEREAMRDVLSVVEARVVEGDDDPAAYRQLATIPSFISNGAIQDMLLTLVELENDRAELLARRTPENQDVRRIDERIAELEVQLHRTAGSYLESLDQQMISAGRTLGRITDDLESLPEREMQYVRLLREKTLLTETYILLQAELKRAEIEEVIVPRTARVVDPGQVPHPDDPAFPKPEVILPLGLLLGLVAGVVIALLLDLWDDRIHSREEAALAVGELPFLAVLPRLEARHRIHLNGRRRLLPSRAGRPGAGDGAAARRLPSAGSQETAAYRSLAATLTVAGERPPRIITVASPQAGDGRTTVAVHLAVTLARQGHRTLLVDGDLRDGAGTRIPGEGDGPGLRGILTGEATFEESVRAVDGEDAPPTLEVLPAGSDSDAEPDLSRRDLLERLLTRMRDEYDRVVVDTSPAHEAPEALILASEGDLVLMVARQGHTDRNALRRLAERLAAVAPRSTRVILNEGTREGAVRG